MELEVVGAGVGRTGTQSLKRALEMLLGAPCHHMEEVMGDPEQMAMWTEAIDGGPVDWATVLHRYRAIVDWPGAAFWPELSAANPDALVLLSVRDPEEWYRSASNTIFLSFDHLPPPLAPWMVSLRRVFRDRFCDRFDDPTAMMDAFVRHNDDVRAKVPADRLLEWTVTDGWEPICERLGLPVPAESFPRSNSTDQFRDMLGLPPMP